MSHAFVPATRTWSRCNSCTAQVSSAHLRGPLLGSDRPPQGHCPLSSHLSTALPGTLHGTRGASQLCPGHPEMPAPRCPPGGPRPVSDGGRRWGDNSRHVPHSRSVDPGGTEPPGPTEYPVTLSPLPHACALRSPPAHHPPQRPIHRLMILSRQPVFMVPTLPDLVRATGTGPCPPEPTKLCGWTWTPGGHH